MVLDRPPSSPLAGALIEAAAEGGDVEFLSSDAVLPRELPFSDGVRVGALVMLSGQLGVRPGTLELVPGGIEPEARQTLENIRRVLAAHGLTLRDVVRVQVMLADMAEWPRFNEVYREFFAPPWPARSAFGANGLALGARLELEAFAVRR
ncbi:MAG: Rid family hydrolase [Xanthobacteraceae bacterium]|nr:Rid family hydrolase [Xanthobacteraceae bacterium]